MVCCHVQLWPLVVHSRPGPCLHWTLHVFPSMLYVLAGGNQLVPYISHSILRYLIKFRLNALCFVTTNQCHFAFRLLATENRKKSWVSKRSLLTLLCQQRESSSQSVYCMLVDFIMETSFRLEISKLNLLKNFPSCTRFVIRGSLNRLIHLIIWKMCVTWSQRHLKVLILNLLATTDNAISCSLRTKIDWSSWTVQSRRHHHQKYTSPRKKSVSVSRTLL